MGGAAPPVAVVGAGLKAPGGNTVDELWASLCAGRPTATRFTDPRFGPNVRVLACRVEGFDPLDHLKPAEVRRTDRSHHLAIGAAQDAVSAAGDTAWPPPERRAVVCGVGYGVAGLVERQVSTLFDQGLKGVSPLAIPMAMPSSVAAHLSLRFGLAGPCRTLSSACASGTDAIGVGAELLRHGAADLVLAGGVDALLTYSIVSMFLRMEVMSANVEQPALASRPFDVERDGFVLGEGAGFVVLERLDDAVAAGRDVLGNVAGYAAAADAHHLVAPDEDGAGALRCVRGALADAGLRPADISHVNAHGTATRLNDAVEGRALAALFDGATPPVTSIKGTTGHLIGGSGAVEAIIALRTLRERLVPPVAGLRRLDPEIPLDVVVGAPRPIGPGAALSTSFGFGGHDAALVLTAPPP
jgi:3-oxoacyl-[acyl-carrier-protein] synthase II